MQSIYDFFKLSPLKFRIKSVDEKLKFIEYKHDSADVIGTSIGLFIIFIFLTIISTTFSVFLVYFFSFFGVIIAITSFIYPVGIIYSQRILQYSEEMLKALMKISTYIQMNQSMEYAIIKSKDELRGTLRTQFKHIIHHLKRREQNTLGEVFEIYTPIWNRYNPDFVKSLRLLETATMSPEEEKKKIINETLETLIANYNTQGKRSAEDLANNAKTLIALGILFPVISLMILPLASVFLPDIINPTILIFVYNVFFPAVILLVSLKFASSRIQVYTIDLKNSPNHKSIPPMIFALCIVIILFFSVPALIHIYTINTSTPETVEREYELLSVLKIWLIPLGIMISVWILSNYYYIKNRKIWEEVNETDRDIPYLMQSISTYLALNMSIEKVISSIIDDYKTHGYKSHPTVKFFTTLNHKLRVTKKSLYTLTKTELPKICPSEKLNSALSQIIGFTDISQESASQASRMIRKQLIFLYKLDDYIKTLLSETTALMGVTINFLAPLLCAAAVLMSLAIVKALTFISNVLGTIQNSMSGGSSAVSMNLVDITAIIPPTIVELIVSLYLIEMVIVLSIFLNYIKVGNDSLQLAKTMKSNFLSFFLFSIVLILGHYIIVGVLFTGFA